MPEQSVSFGSMPEEYQRAFLEKASNIAAQKGMNISTNRVTNSLSDYIPLVSGQGGYLPGYGVPSTFGGSVQYDASGRMIGTSDDMGSYGQALMGLGESDTAYQNYINQIMGTYGQSPYADQIAGQTQAMYAGMGLLGTPAASTAMTQAITDYLLGERQQSLGMLGLALSQQASLRGDIASRMFDIDKYKRSLYESDRSAYLSLLGAEQSAQNQQNLLERQYQLEEEYSPSFLEQMGLGLAQGASGGLGTAAGKSLWG